MKRLLSALLIVFLLGYGLPFSFAGAASAASPTAFAIPTFSIISVVADQSVTIKTYNFPAHDTFDVLMNTMGTRGVNGIKVATVSSGGGGSFNASFSIPAALKGQYQIAIRLQSNTGSGYFSFNWFYNNLSGTSTGGGGIPPAPGYSGIPTFSILSVTRNISVTVQTNNFPAHLNFDVLMNFIGTRGVNGYKVATIDSGSGGAFQLSFTIPAELKGQRQVAIRLQNTGTGYFAYNWFWNTSTGTSGGSTGGGGVPPAPGYSGFPTFSIASVVRNQAVTVTTRNLPPNDRFQVLMGPMGTRGVNGFVVTTFDTGAGGTQTLTFNIPAELKGSFQIAIRMQSPTSGFFAYNWFYNTTAQ